MATKNKARKVKKTFSQCRTCCPYHPRSLRRRRPPLARPVGQASSPMFKVSADCDIYLSVYISIYVSINIKI